MPPTKGKKRIRKPRAKKQKEVLRTSKGVEPVRVVKFKTVDVPKIKHYPSTTHTAEQDVSTQLKKQQQQPVIIHNYLYPAGDQSASIQDYQTQTASQIPLRPATPSITKSSREFINYDEIPTEPFPVSYGGGGGGGGTWKDVEAEIVEPITVKSKKLTKMEQLQARGGPYTVAEAKLVFGLDLRTRTDKELLAGMREQGLVI